MLIIPVLSISIVVVPNLHNWQNSPIHKKKLPDMQKLLNIYIFFILNLPKITHLINSN